MGGRAPRNPEAGMCLVGGEEYHRRARAGGDRGQGQAAWPEVAWWLLSLGSRGRHWP